MEVLFKEVNRQYTNTNRKSLKSFTKVLYMECNL